MKRFSFLALLLFIMFSCNEKEKQIIVEEAMVPPVNSFSGEYAQGGIVLNWDYSYTGQIEHYLLYYAPGGETTDTLSPYQLYYQIPHAVADTNYLFNIKVVDKKGHHSEAQVLRLSTY